MGCSYNDIIIIIIINAWNSGITCGVLQVKIRRKEQLEFVSYITFQIVTSLKFSRKERETKFIIISWIQVDVSLDYTSYYHRQVNHSGEIVFQIAYDHHSNVGSSVVVIFVYYRKKRGPFQSLLPLTCYLVTEGVKAQQIVD